jgi:hypothetical protein
MNLASTPGCCAQRSFGAIEATASTCVGGDGDGLAAAAEAPAGAEAVNTARAPGAGLDAHVGQNVVPFADENTHTTQVGAPQVEQV